MLFALLNNKQLIGMYTDYNLCLQMIDGLVDNNFVKRNNLSIKAFFDNSITSTTYEKESLVKVETKNIIVDKNNIIDPEKNKLANDIQNELSLLKKQKEKLEESKKVYEVDIELYNKFKNIKKENINFQIPDMFIDKYELMEKLENENKLCWENFNSEYKHPVSQTSYTRLFDSE
jgi:hypothetical protein